MSAHWANSKHRERGGRIPEPLRMRVLRKAGYKCRVVKDGRPCLAPAKEVDHKTPVSQGGLTVEDNLQAICRECHKPKTQAEAWQANPLRRRHVDEEPHPGLQ